MVLVVVGIILGIVASTSGKSLIGASHAQAVQATVKDLSEAMVRFRERYGYLPGDMPNATARIPGVTAGSCSVTANGNGDGQIDAGEVACVPNHLFNAGFIDERQDHGSLFSSVSAATNRATLEVFCAASGPPTPVTNAMSSVTVMVVAPAHSVA